MSVPGFPVDGRIMIIMRVFGEPVDQLVHAFNGQIFMQHVVDEHNRSGAAGAQAFQFDQREPAIGRRFPFLELQLSLQVIGQFAGLTDLAGKRPANLSRCKCTLAGLETLLS